MQTQTFPFNSLNFAGSQVVQAFLISVFEQDLLKYLKIDKL